MPDNAVPAPFDATQTHTPKLAVADDDGATRIQAPGTLPPTFGNESTHAIAGYDVVKKVGGGGMGVVYLARQQKLNRVVALKVIRAEQASNIDLARFAIEAEASARVKHPNLVQVFDYNAGDGGGRPYIAMEHCSGGNLAEFLDRRPQLPKLAASIAETLARAVQAAHEAEILHRDLKPANVLLAFPVVPEGNTKKGTTSGADEPGEVTKRFFSADLLKLTDFGLAKKLDSLDGMTQLRGGI